MDIKMDFSFNPLLWFVCGQCRNVFSDTDQLKKHKLETHFKECFKTKCIIFEERPLDYEWSPRFPTNIVNHPNSNSHLINPVPVPVLLNRQTNDSNVSVSGVNRELFQIQKKPNPFVLLRRLSSKELNSALKGKSNYGNTSRSLTTTLRGRKRSICSPESASLTKNNDDSPVPSRSKQAKVNHATETENKNDCDSVPIETPKSSSPLAQGYSASQEFGTTNANAPPSENMDLAVPPDMEFEIEVQSEIKEEFNQDCFVISGNENEAEEPSSFDAVVENVDATSSSSLVGQRASRYRTRKNNSKINFTKLCSNSNSEMDLCDDSDFEVSDNVSNHNTDSESELKPKREPQKSKDSQILPLKEWFVKQQEKSKNVIILDPNLPALECFTISKENPVTCKLCATKLVNDPEVRVHVENCWLHNKNSHRFCILCIKEFKNPMQLKHHHLTVHFEEKGAPKSESKSQTETETDAQTVTETGNLAGWLQELKKNQKSSNVILLDPDPTNKSNKNFTVNKKSPITCKLCLLKLVSEKEVKDHVQNCWQFNQKKHRYCVPCKITFSYVRGLRQHNRLKHNNSKVKLPCHFYCDACNAEFLSKLEFNHHQQSLMDFQAHLKLKSSYKYANSVDTTTVSKENDNNSPDSLFLEWQKIQDVNSVTSGQIPPPVSEPDTVTPENPVTCKLCLTKLGTTAQVRNHGENCWLHNKDRHVYCTLCHVEFQYSFQLTRHNRNVHSNSHENDRKNNDNSGDEDEEVNEGQTPVDMTKARVSKDLPLKEWLKNVRVENPSNVILLEPDPENLETFTITETSSITCKLCILKLTSEEELKTHVEMCYTSNKRKHRYCVPCKITFSYKKGLRQHNRKRHFINDVIPTVCKVCKTQFSGRGSDFQRHKVSLEEFLRNQNQNNDKNQKPEDRPLANRKRPTFQCKVCSKEFLNRINFMNHAEYSHSENPPKMLRPFSCTVCSHAFRTKINLTRHMNCHSEERPFKCPECSMAFKHKRSVKKHLLVHGKVSNYKCSFCERSFFSQCYLDDHERSHTGERPFKCQIENCPSAFTSKSGLKLHNHVKHSKEIGLERFLCPTCGRTFGLNAHLKRHVLRMHSNDKPYKCVEEIDDDGRRCSKAFKSKRELEEHARVHTGEKPYQCDQCGHAYARKWNFVRHQRFHEENFNRFVCHLCSRKFLVRSELKNHLKRAHKCQLQEGNEKNSDTDKATEAVLGL